MAALPDYVALALLFGLVVAAFYGSMNAKVRYYRWGMTLLLVGFLLEALQATGRVAELLSPELQAWTGIAGNAVLLSGMLVLTWYRGKLGL